MCICVWRQALLFSSSSGVQRSAPGPAPETPVWPAPEGSRLAERQDGRRSCPALPLALGRSHTENTAEAGNT